MCFSLPCFVDRVLFSHPISLSTQVPLSKKKEYASKSGDEGYRAQCVCFVHVLGTVGQIERAVGNCLVSPLRPMQECEFLQRVSQCMLGSREVSDVRTFSAVAGTLSTAAVGAATSSSSAARHDECLLFGGLKKEVECVCVDW